MNNKVPSGMHALRVYTLSLMATLVHEKSQMSVKDLKRIVMRQTMIAPQTFENYLETLAKNGYVRVKYAHRTCEGCEDRKCEVCRTVIWRAGGKQKTLLESSA